MALQIPTTKEIKDQNIANYENELGQNVPIAQKAFIRVDSGINAMNMTQLYKFGVEATKQNLALTATGSNLDTIGENYGLNRKKAVAAVLEVTFNASGSTFEVGLDMIGDSNQERYFNDAQVIESGGVGVLSVTAENAGVAGNLNNGEVVSLATQVAGSETAGTVTNTLTLGTEEETDDEYRIRILDKIRSEGGGGNSADYRNWAQEAAGVQRAYPFAGRPIADPSAPPPARTVFIEATNSIDPDGIATAGVLAAARASLTTDPETGIARQPLGLTDDTLYLVSIIRTAIFITINTLDVEVDQEAQVKSDIETALTQYLDTLEPYVEGLDPAFLRNDLLTDLSLSKIIQDVLESVGGTAGSVSFGTAPAVNTVSYRLLANEKLKLGAIAYT